MFDVGISEMALIAVIALIVLGPERLPKAARMAGALVRRARSAVSSLHQELEREIAADELKKHLRDAERGMNETMDTVRGIDPVADIKQALSDPPEAESGPKP
ncbi:MAG: twin-arginine translocase subunit TatB [Ahniella sp.]|nr:twin-arginine translocase subunit TatB [Ahniella sp.]